MIRAMPERKRFFLIEVFPKVDGYADDLTLVLPRIERAVRAAMRAVESFALVSGLRINKDKTQVLKIGYKAESDAETSA